MIWTESTHSANWEDTYARIFNADGTPFGDAFIVGSDPTDIEESPVIAALPQGGFVIGWIEWGGLDVEIRTQVFGNDGTADGGEVTLATSSVEFDIAALLDGRFVLAFGGHARKFGDKSNDGVVAQIFDPRGEGVDLDGNDVGNDMYGTAFSDVLQGLGGKDILRGLGGNDSLFGDDGNDRLLGGNGSNSLFGGSGNDLLKGGKDSDRLEGQGNNDKLFGGGGEDELHGGDGKDRLFGGAGADQLDGGDGNDILKGQGGADLFIYSGGRDRFLDIADNLDHLAIDFTALGIEAMTKREILKLAKVKQGDLVLKFSADDILRIEDFGPVKALGNDPSFIG